MARCQFTDDARDDLREIKKFSQQQFGARVTREYLAGMRDTMQHLANMPGMGINEADELLPGVWSFPYISHTVYYQAIRGGIIVIAIVHQSRQPKLLLNRRT